MAQGDPAGSRGSHPAVWTSCLQGGCCVRSTVVSTDPSRQNKVDKSGRTFSHRRISVGNECTFFPFSLFFFLLSRKASGKCLSYAFYLFAPLDYCWIGCILTRADIQEQKAANEIASSIPISRSASRLRQGDAGSESAAVFPSVCVRRCWSGVGVGGDLWNNN